MAGVLWAQPKTRTSSLEQVRPLATVVSSVMGVGLELG